MRLPTIIDVARVSEPGRRLLEEAEFDWIPKGLQIWLTITEDNVEDIVHLAQALGTGLDLWTPPTGDPSNPLACLLIERARLLARAGSN